MPYKEEKQNPWQQTKPARTKEKATLDRSSWYLAERKLKFCVRGPHSWGPGGDTIKSCIRSLAFINLLFLVPRNTIVSTEITLGVKQLSHANEYGLLSSFLSTTTPKGSRDSMLGERRTRDRKVRVRIPAGVMGKYSSPG